MSNESFAHTKIAKLSHIIGTAPVLQMACPYDLRPWLYVPWGACFSKVPNCFRTWKAVNKSQTLWLQNCFILIFLIYREVLFTLEVSGVYTSQFLDTDLKLQWLWRSEKFPGLLRNAPWPLWVWCSPLRGPSGSCSQLWKIDSALLNKLVFFFLSLKKGWVITSEKYFIEWTVKVCLTRLVILCFSFHLVILH